MEAGLNFFDYLLLAVIGISMIMSFYRGFIREAISLIGLVVAFLVAQQFSGPTGSFLTQWVASRGIADVLGFALVFIVALIFMGLLGTSLGKLMDLAELSGTDRGLGLMFGLARGLLLIAIAALLYTSYGKLDKSWLKESMLTPYAVQLGDLLGQVIPENCPLSRHHGTLDKTGKTADNITGKDSKALKAIIESNLH